MSAQDFGERSGNENSPGREPPTAEAPSRRYRAAVQQIFENEHVVREALRDSLLDPTTESLEIRSQAARAFSGFTASRYSPTDRGMLTYLAPGDNLVSLQTDQTIDALSAQRNAPGDGRLRLRLTPNVLSLIDTTDATDERVGWLTLARLLDLLQGSEPLPPPAPAAACSAGSQADALIAAITARPEVAVTEGPPSGGRAGGGHPRSMEATDVSAEAGRTAPTAVTGAASSGPEVLAKIKELLAAMRTPETAPTFEVVPRADQSVVRENLATFELRSGPADVTSYHDFTSLRIAFQSVWTEVFDGRLEAVGRELYEELVKLKTFAGIPPGDQTIDTLDDLKRLMTEARDLAQITIDATPAEVRPPTSSGVTVSQGTAAVDMAKEVVLGGPTGNPLVDALLNPAGAVIEAIGNLFAGKQQLTWESFPGPLPVGNDVITVRFEPDAVAAGTVEFVIENGPQAWWWKGIEFREFDTGGTVVADFRISNDPTDRGVWQADSFNRLPLYTNQLPNAVLEFQKAAPGLGFGVHTGYYLLTNLQSKMPDRMRATFRWEKDS